MPRIVGLLEKLSFKLSDCGSGYFGLAKLIVWPKVLIIYVITREIQLCT
jgi:hypothetical protein